MATPDNIKVLILCPESNLRKELSRLLTENGFELMHVKSIDACQSSLSDFRPLLLVHDWSVADEEQCRAFALGFLSREENRPVHRVLLAEKATPRMNALAVDSGVEHLLEYDCVLDEIVPLIHRLTEGPRSELEQALIDIRMGYRTYAQDEVDQTIEQAYGNDPDDRQVALEYGGLSLRRDDFQESRGIADRILALDPSDVRAMNLLSRVHLRLGEFDLAIMVLERAQLFSPRNPERIIMLGDAYFGKGDLERAFELYDEARLLQPEGVHDAEKKMAEVKMRQGEMDAVMDIITRSLSEDESASFFNNMGVAAVRAGKPSDALRLYEIAFSTLKTPRLKAAILFNMALAHWRQGSLVLAVEHMQRALEAQPDHHLSNKYLPGLRTRCAA